MGVPRLVGGEEEESMAEPLKNDIYGESPRYPEPSPTAAVPPPLPGMPAPLPTASRLDEDEDRSSGIASRAVDATKETAANARERLQVVAGRAKRQINQMTDRAGDLAGQAGQTASRIKDAAVSRVSDLRDTIQDRMPEWRRQARNGVRQAQATARDTTHRYPVQVIAGAAAFGFLIGFALRFWRSNRV